MTASIFGDRYLGVRELPWHNLGTTIPEPVPVSQAVMMAGLDYEVTTEPLFISNATAADPAARLDTGKVAIVRMPTTDDAEKRIFGFASKDYEVLSNLDLAALLEPLNKEWPVETVGALGFGEKTFMTLDAGLSAIKGEEVRKFLLLSDEKTGGGSLKIAFTPVRVVCQNTLSLGLAAATFTATINHTKGAKNEADFRMRLIAGAKKAEAHSMEVLARMATTKVVEAQIEAIVAAAYPMPTEPKKVALYNEIKDLTADHTLEDSGQLKKLFTATETYDYYRGRVEAFRAGAITLYEKFNDEFPDTAGTAWAIYNAVVECSDFRRGGKNVEESIIFGERSREKTRAFRAAAAIT